MFSELRKLIPIKLIYISHIFIIGLTLLYIGYKKNNTPKNIFNLLYIFSLGIVSIVIIRKIDFSYWSLIKLMHYIVILPLFLYIAYKKNFTHSQYNSIFGLGLIVIVYQSYKLYLLK
tara:strand:- start:361 stop:711 length:351 start_codon:yes stop_codon:yes gene_type:complete